jgi:hypothetical protein
LAAQTALDLSHEVIDVDDRDHDIRTRNQAGTELAFG